MSAEWKFWEKTEYQLVLEFVDDGSGTELFERISNAELELEGSLEFGELDGNDVGGGVINLFFVTTQPRECFLEVSRRLETKRLMPSAAGYRDLNGDEYTRVWPTGDGSTFVLR